MDTDTLGGKDLRLMSGKFVCFVLFYLNGLSEISQVLELGLC